MPMLTIKASRQITLLFLTTGQLASFKPLKYSRISLLIPFRINFFILRVLKSLTSSVNLKSLATACDGEEIWSPCHGCEISCDELECSGGDRKCEPGCFCPPHKPIRHQGQCITFEQCPANQIQPKCGTSGLFIGNCIIESVSNATTGDIDR